MLRNIVVAGCLVFGTFAHASVVNMGQGAGGVRSQQVTSQQWSLLLEELESAEERESVSMHFRWQIINYLVRSTDNERANLIYELIALDLNATVKTEILLETLTSLECDAAKAVASAIHAEFPHTAESSNAHFLLAQCYWMDGRIDQQALELETLIEENPQSILASQAHQQLGLHYERKERRLKSRSHYESVLRIASAESQSAIFARRGLQRLDQYVLSPFYDRIMYLVDTSLIGRVFPATPRPPVAHIINLGIVVVLMNILLILSIAVVRILSKRIERARLHQGPYLFELSWVSLAALFVGRVFILYACTVCIALYLDQQNSANFHEILGAAHALCRMVIWVVILAIILRGKNLLEVFSFRFVPKTIFIFLLGLMAGFLVIHFDVGPQIQRPSGFDLEHPLGLLLTQVFVLAAGEEFLFRGVINDTVKRYSGPIAAALISSVLFSASHMVPIMWSMQLFVFGLLMVWLRKITRSMIAPVLCHAAVNGLILLVRA